MHLTLQNRFLEGPRFFLPLGNHGVSKEKLHFKNWFPKKVSGYDPEC